MQKTPTLLSVVLAFGITLLISGLSAQAGSLEKRSAQLFHSMQQSRTAVAALLADDLSWKDLTAGVVSNKAELLKGLSAEWAVNLRRQISDVVERGDKSVLDAVLAAAVATDTWRQERALLWAGAVCVLVTAEAAQHACVEAQPRHKGVDDQALSGAGVGSITTEILDAPTYYYAEDYHQQYLAKNPNGYCGIGGCGVPFKIA